MFRLLIFCLSFNAIINSQGIPIDPSVIKELKNSGITLEQAKQIIKQKQSNIPSVEPRLNDRLNKVEQLDQQKEKIEEELKIIDQSNITLDPILEEKYEPEEKPKNIKDGTENIQNVLDSIEYFGYKVFSGNPDIFQGSISESVDPEYLIGPGDEVIIMLWGETELNETYIVSREGYLFIENIGQVFVNGLSLKKLEKKLFRLLKKAYASLDAKSGNATTFFDVSLGALVLRPIRIFVLGELIQPGAYNVKPATSLFTSLYFFNGPSINGSLRNIQLVRDEKIISNIDFYDYLLTGKKVNDVRLQRDDVVFIPPRGKTITVDGEINRPAIYELDDNENLRDLIKIAGGLKPTTYMKRIQIQRIIPPEKRSTVKIDRTIVDVNINDTFNSTQKTVLYDGDIIQFFKITDIQGNTVTIDGSINRPGIYDLGDGLYLKDIINKADGVTGDVYLDRIDIFRKNPDYSETQIDVNLELAMKGDKENNLKLMSGDVITVYSKSDMFFSTNVSIKGHISNPGSKPFRKGMQVSDLVFMGGGFENEEHIKNTYFDRAELLRKDPKKFKPEIITFRLDSVLAGRGISTMQLEMGDEITIYSLQDVIGEANNFVEIMGHVKRPGRYNLGNKMKISDLLFMAGGFDDDFHLSTTFLKRADLIRKTGNPFNEIIKSFSLKDILIDKQSEKDFLLIPEDQIRIYSDLMFRDSKTIEINGEIASPGSYQLKKDMTLKDLILEADGVSPDIFRFRADISRIVSNKIDEANFAEIITINLNNSIKDFAYGQSRKEKSDYNTNNIILKPYDIITIRSDPNFSKQKKVTITGFVYYPGDYVISKPDELVTDIISRAGGLRPEAYPANSKLTRAGEIIQLSFKNIIKNPRSKFNFSIIEDDSIYIGSFSNLVVINGEVNTPGNYQYIKGTRLDGYIKMSGGYTKEASRFATYVTYPNGKSQRLSLLKFSPKIIDGSVITVGRKEEVEAFSMTEYVTNLTSIYADISQAYLLVLLASRQ